MSKQRIVITGLGIISPLGFGKELFWNSLIKGKSGIKQITNFDTSEFESKKGGEIVGFEPREYLKRKSIRNLDKITCFAISAAHLALEDAKLEINDTNSEKAGIILGTMYSGWASIIKFQKDRIQEGPKRLNPMLFPNTVLNAPASQISIEFGARCFNTTLSTGFSSGTDAIGLGFNYLRQKKADFVLAGGAEDLNEWVYGNFSLLGCLSGSNGKEECRPFDVRRNGLVLGEGAGMLVLETLEHAERRGANIYAEIIGYGATNDASVNPFMTNSIESPAKAMKMALEDAKISPLEVDYINAEGNSTLEGDKMETKAIHQVFEEYAHKIPISSIKPMIGHSLGAAGAFDISTSALAVKNDVIPPTINYQESDPECDLNYVPNCTQKKKVEIALSNSFGLGGNNASLVIKKYNPNSIG